MKTIIASAIAIAAMTVAAHAQIKPPTTNVPEIDAAAGVAAVAALGATVALLRERFKR